MKGIEPEKKGRKKKGIAREEREGGKHGGMYALRG